MSEDRLSRIERKLDMLLVRLGVIAPARELDGQYGDPQARFSPRDWKGEDIKGKPLSECPVEALEMLAAAFDNFARKNQAAGAVDDKGRPKADFDRRSAALVRGWIERKRAMPPPRPRAPVNEKGKGDAYEGDDPPKAEDTPELETEF